METVGVILNEHVFDGVKKSLKEKVMWIKVYFLGVKKKPIDDHVYFVGGVAKRLLNRESESKIAHVYFVRVLKNRGSESKNVYFVGGVKKS